MTTAEMIERARKALEEIRDYDQAQIDKIVYEAAKIIYINAKPLAKEAVTETSNKDRTSCRSNRLHHTCNKP